jgi:hypothetical protein
VRPANPAQPSSDALAALCSRLWTILSAADRDCAEMVEINESANQDSPPPPLPRITCPACAGDGQVGVQVHPGGRSPDDYLRTCDECEGAGTVAPTCECGEPATVRTGDPAHPYTCDRCEMEAHQ